MDLYPPDGGTCGQVILIGPDEDERRVLAPSLTALFASAHDRVDIATRIAGQTTGIWRSFNIEGDIP